MAIAARGPVTRFPSWGDGRKSSCSQPTSEGSHRSHYALFDYMAQRSQLAPIDKQHVGHVAPAAPVQLAEAQRRDAVDALLGLLRRVITEEVVKLDGDLSNPQNEIVRERVDYGKLRSLDVELQDLDLTWDSGV